MIEDNGYLGQERAVILRLRADSMKDSLEARRFGNRDTAHIEAVNHIPQAIETRIAFEPETCQQHLEAGQVPEGIQVASQSRVSSMSLSSIFYSVEMGSFLPSRHASIACHGRMAHFTRFGNL